LNQWRGEIEHVIEKKAISSIHRIYLSLQEDEVELANPLFRDIFNDPLITIFKMKASV
jgi:DNA primase